MDQRPQCRDKTIKLLEENLIINPCYLRLHSCFSDMTPKSKTSKENNKLCSKIEVENFNEISIESLLIWEC